MYACMHECKQIWRSKSKLSIWHPNSKIYIGMRLETHFPNAYIYELPVFLMVALNSHKVITYFNHLFPLHP